MHMNHHWGVLKHHWTQPLVSDLLQHRVIGWAVLGAIGLQVGLISLGLPGWPCPIRHTLGVPCPGCGLSRASTALLRGDWEAALAYHALAPLLWLFIFLLGVASLIPDRSRHWLLDHVTRIEGRLGLGALGLATLFIYWLVRLLFYHNTYMALIVG